jgi:hypothetical protein
MVTLTRAACGAAGNLLAGSASSVRQAWRVAPVPVLIVGLGLVVTVAPLTTAAMASPPDGQAGVDSGINNTLARAGGRIVVAALPAVMGVGDRYTDPHPPEGAYQDARWACTTLLIVGALIAAILVRPKPGLLTRRGGEAALAAPTAPGPVLCAVDAPSLQLDEVLQVRSS